jgi:hypothetical protein
MASNYSERGIHFYPSFSLIIVVVVVAAAVVGAVAAADLYFIESVLVRAKV